jgi:hypothetical protein
MKQRFFHRVFWYSSILSCTAFSAPNLFTQNAAPDPLENKISTLLANDNIREADSLCTAFDLTRFMGPFDLVKWLRIKGTLGQYGQAGRLACLATGKDPHFGPMLQYQLAEVVKDAKIDTVRAVLQAYVLCALGEGKCDTMAFKQ